MSITKQELQEIIDEEYDAYLEEQMLDEEGKKDACYHKVKARYKVWPSAYASGALVQCRKKGAKNWGNKSKNEEVTPEEEEELDDIKGELANASKMHQSQSDRIKKITKNEGEEKESYKVKLKVVSRMEEKNSKCTKVTKKASSTRKGKKWMKCVKSDSGGYKRIHWGQAGVRVTGKSGNTKRKKSFKARHGCKGAKSNTPKGQACKDWAE
jgi:hypothetical protein